MVLSQSMSSFSLVSSLIAVQYADRSEGRFSGGRASAPAARSAQVGTVRERLDQRLLEVADPLVDVVGLGAWVVVGQRGPHVLVALLDAEPGRQGEAQVRE